LTAAKGGLFVGDETFVEKFRELLEACDAREESVRREKYAARPPLQEIFNSLDRDAGIHDAVLKWRYPLKEVGNYVGLHYSRVSRVAFLMAESKKAKNKT
jgi:heterodisulfide reductase subunit B